MNDIKDLEQLIENVRFDISKNEKYNKNYYYKNNGDLLKIIKKRFIKNNINEDDKIKISKNNIKAHKQESKNEKKFNFICPFFALSVINSFFSFLFLIILTYEKGFYLSNLLIFFISNIFIMLFSLKYVDLISRKKNNMQKECEKNISDVFLKNYNGKMLKVALSVIKDLESIKKESNADIIEVINKRLIEQAFLFDNNKTKDFMDSSLKEDIISELFHLEATKKENLDNKLMKKEDLFEDNSLENKLDLLLKKTI